MKRIVWCLAVLLALVTAPALCQSGTVEHECSCAPGVSECSHENACAEDPCAWFASAGGRPAPQTPAPMVAAPPSFYGLHAVSQSGLALREDVRCDLHRRGIEHSTTILVV